jgi:hypothetical protein
MRELEGRAEALAVHLNSPPEHASASWSPFNPDCLVSKKLLVLGITAPTASAGAYYRGSRLI